MNVVDGMVAYGGWSAWSGAAALRYEWWLELHVATADGAAHCTRHGCHQYPVFAGHSQPAHSNILGPSNIQ